MKFKFYQKICNPYQDYEFLGKKLFSVCSKFYWINSNAYHTDYAKMKGFHKDCFDFMELKTNYRW